MDFRDRAIFADCRSETEGILININRTRKAAQKESMRNVSRSGEKGRTASLWLVGESRMLYVRTKGNIAEALNYNLLMYKGGHMGKKGILSNLYGVLNT